MDRAEVLAKQLIEKILPGSDMHYREDQSHSVPDFDLIRPSGKSAVVEVTISADRTILADNAAIRRPRNGERDIKSKLCKKDWYIHPARGAPINKIRKDADAYLAAIENDGYERFWSQTQWDVPSIGRIYRDLGIISGSVLPWKEPGYIRISTPGGGGAVGASVAIDAIGVEAGKEDNRRKLMLSGAQERHLVVHIDISNYRPWASFLDFDPPPVLPSLPSEITHIWAFADHRAPAMYTVWTASQTEAWHNLSPVTLP